MIDLALIGILVVIVGAVSLYVYKAKKRGQKCIGCPAGCSCSGKHGRTACHCHDDEHR